jgi:hypothetical protein
MPYEMDTLEGRTGGDARFLGSRTAAYQLSIDA